MQTTNASFATHVLAGWDKAARGVAAVWTLIKIVVVASALIWLASWRINSDQSPKVSYETFVSMASPLETVNQDFSIGNHEMPSIAVLASPSEAERMASPGMTAAQIQRARWMWRTWEAVNRRGESQRQIGAADRSFAVELVSAAVSESLGKDQKTPKSNTAEGQSNVRVLIGPDLIPSLDSGKLPVFTDADTSKWRGEAARQNLRLSELDMRRAKFFQTKYGMNMMPSKSPDDLEIRAEEKLEAESAGRWERRPVAPLSANERLELAVGVLNVLAGGTK